MSNKNIKIYYLTSFFDSLVFIIPIIFVYLQARVSIPQITFLFGFRYFIQLVAEMPTGAIADLLGKRLSIFLGYAISILYFVLLIFSHSFWQFLITYALGGIGDSFLSGATDALIYDSLKQEKKEKSYSVVLSQMNIVWQIGLIIGTITGGFLYSFYQYLPIILCLIGQIIAAFISLFYTEPLIDTLKFNFLNYVKQLKFGFKELFKNEYIAKISIYYIAIGGITWTCVMMFNSYILVDLGFSDKMRGIIEGSLRLINILILTQLLKNEKIFTRNISFIFFPVMMTLSLLPGIFLKNYFAIPFIAGSMMSGTARFLILGKYTNQEFDSKYRATAISTLSMFVGMIYVVIVIASGPIIAYFGGVRTVYSILGLLSLIIITPLCIDILKHHKKLNTFNTEG